MRALLTLFKMRFMLQLQYRIAAYAGVFTQLFFGMVLIMIYDAFFDNGMVNLPMNFSQTVTYIWLGQALLALLPWNGDREVQGVIRSGDLVYEWVKPINLYYYWFVKIMAQRIAPTILRAIPLLFIIIIILPKTYHIGGPVSFKAFGAFVISMIGAIILGCAVSNIITISALFTIGDGMDRLFPAIVIFFSGMVIPIAFFPDWAQNIFRLLPFSGLMDTPYRFYLGLYELAYLKWAILHQWVWVILFVVCGKWLLLKASRRLIVQGG